jgi:Trypsin-like peptidase domain/von Willebrand factor type A domain
VSHVVGTVQTIAPVIIGPDSGQPPSAPNTWSFDLTPAAPPVDKTKYVILHFTNISLPANNYVEVDLGYDTDQFTSADGADFWTRPIDISKFGGKATVRYVTNGAANGGVTLDKYGRGERHAGIQDPTALSNCDPFLLDDPYVEPKYDPFWFCNTPPNVPPDWENTRCIAPANDGRATVARSVGMILHVDGNNLSTCSVTLVGTDLVITAGHCMTDPIENAKSGSVIFNYETECNKARPGGYAPYFFKVKKTVRQKFNGTGTTDYCFFQLKVPIGGTGLPAIPMRSNLPAVGEIVFGLHHPNGAVKKLSIPHPNYQTVMSSSMSGIGVNLDVSGGSSGSGLFDFAGGILGVLSFGGPCGLTYWPMAAILQDLATPPGPQIARDVMMVFDRSGSMSMDSGGGQSKIDEARDAAALFVSLVRAGGANRLGLVSFSTQASNPVDFAIAGVTAANKTTLIGPPLPGSIVGNLVADGFTTIGGGLKAGAEQMIPAGANPRSILLMTDGLQNTPPMIEYADVQGALSGIDVNAIGFGTEANLDGALLTQVAEQHNGLYTRAGDGLALKKYFALAFGNIFEAGALMDPEFDLPRDQKASAAIPFRVCGEETITIVIGWDNPGAVLLAQLITPGGATVNGASPGVEQAIGRTWSFLRVPLPFGGQRDGSWKVTVVRPGAVDVGFAPPSPAAHGFVNVIANGGPRLLRGPWRSRYYTGQVINPLVMLKYADSGIPDNAKVRVTVKRPSASLGNILSQAKLKSPVVLGGDTIPARQATLMAIGTATGKPVVDYAETAFDLASDPESAGGVFETDGMFGSVRKDLLTVEGHYTFHFVATYGTSCVSTRELQCSLTVHPSIDPGRTGVTTKDDGARPDGQHTGTVTLTPRDPYGNYVGPGRGGEITVSGVPGTTVSGQVTDNGDGTYTVPVVWAPGTGGPGVVVTQPGRPPVVVAPSSKAPGKGCWWWILVVALIVLVIVLFLMWLFK